jgi:hypothetical protein
MTITIYTDRCNSRPEYRLFEDFQLSPSTFLNVTLNIFNCPPKHLQLLSIFWTLLNIFYCLPQYIQLFSSTSSNVLSVLNRLLANSKWKVKTSFQSQHSLQYSIISSPERWALLGRNAVSLGEYILTFQRVLLPTSSGSNSSGLPQFKISSPKDAASHSKLPEPPAKTLWTTWISQTPRTNVWYADCQDFAAV